jgi:hypothetical protein
MLFPASARGYFVELMSVHRSITVIWAAASAGTSITNISHLATGRSCVSGVGLGATPADDDALVLVLCAAAGSYAFIRIVLKLAALAVTTPEIAREAMVTAGFEP